MSKVIDLETDGLSYTKIHVLVSRDLKTNEVKVITNYEDMVEHLLGCDHIIGHNFLGFDWWVIYDLLNLDIPIENVTDTLVMSRLDNSNRDGGHSLEAWGKLLGVLKPEHEDWSVLSDTMIHRCTEDTAINLKLYNLLLNSLRDKEVPFTELELECFIHWKMKQVERNGFYFDIEECLKLRGELLDKRTKCELELGRLFPPLAEAKKVKGEYVETVPILNKDGRLNNRNLRGCDPSWFTEDAPFYWIEWPEASFTRDAFIRRHLELAGWKPKQFTPTGLPKLDDEQLDDIIAQVGEKYKPYQEWRLLNTRITKQIDKWLEFYNDDTHRQHGKIIHIGTRTHRMAHRDPPITQVPASDSPYGEECRACWTVPEDRVLLGTDASGIQLRILAHYLESDDWTNELINGDVHTRNADILGIPRPKAKTFIYSFLLGAGTSSLSVTINKSIEETNILYNRFIKDTPGLKEFMDRKKTEAKKGYIRSTISNRWIPCQSTWHGDWLASLLQEGEATIMKRALKIWCRQAEKKGVQYWLSTQNHDEWQTELLSIPDAETLGKIQVLSLEQAGRYYKTKCPITGEFKIGKTWKDTH